MLRLYLLLIPLVASAVVKGYWKDRQEILDIEKQSRLGADLQLSKKEEDVNRILLWHKTREFKEGYESPLKFLGSRHFFEVRGEIRNSEVFKFIQKVPKGGLLHVHSHAMTSLEYLYGLTHKSKLYICYRSGKLQFTFLKKPDATCDWRLLSQLRPNETLEEEIMRTISIVRPKEEYPDINSVWGVFQNMFRTTSPIICFKPIFTEYFYEALRQCYEDNVTYVEIRAHLPPVYELDGSVLDEVAVTGLYYDTLNKFITAHPNFFGAKLIYAPLRGVDDTTMHEYIRIISEVTKQYPGFVIGFDLVGQEDLGKPLVDFVETLRKFPVKLFLHAGETNWFGLTDENLIDAILLGTERIGHGYALAKHPKLLEMIKDRNVTIEVCPISNQVLKLVEDLRNHPAVTYLANGYRVVIANDDPSAWGAEGVSYDWYYTFMAFGHRQDDLRLLKKLGQNSILFSALESAEMDAALAMLDRDWDRFLDDVLQSDDASIVLNIGKT